MEVRSQFNLQDTQCGVISIKCNDAELKVMEIMDVMTDVLMGIKTSNRNSHIATLCNCGGLI